MKIRFYLTITGLFLVAAGLIGSQYLIVHAQSSNVLPTTSISSSQVSAVPEGATLSGIPKHIAIPSVGISVDIDEGTYDTKTTTWTLGETRPSWAVITAQANTASGNTYIYGHNRKGIFETLPDVKPGAKAIVDTTNGHRFVYEMVSAKDVVPTDTSLFDYRGKPIMTLQTCTGILYQHRHLVTFKLVGAN